LKIENKRSAKGELVFTSFLFVAGVVVLVDASQLPDALGVDFVGTKTFPSIIGALLVFLSALQLVSVFRGQLGEPEGIEGGQADNKVHLKPLALVLGGLVFFAVGLPYLGFLVSATVLFSLVVFALKITKAKWYLVLLLAAGFSLVLYAAFNYGLQIKLPLGFDFNFNPDEVVVEEEW
jgi:putative tricarboxylic transport membrane protein